MTRISKAIPTHLCWNLLLLLFSSVEKTFNLPLICFPILRLSTSRHWGPVSFIPTDFDVLCEETDYPLSSDQSYDNYGYVYIVSLSFKVSHRSPKELGSYKPEIKTLEKTKVIDESWFPVRNSNSVSRLYRGQYTRVWVSPSLTIWTLNLVYQK